MFRAAVFVVSVGVLCLTGSVDAQAEPIRITGGHLDFNGLLGSGSFQAGALSIVGTRGFSVDGLVDSGETRVDLATSFGLPAGSTVSAVAEIEGPALVGRGTLDGQTYDDLNGLNSPDFIDLTLSGTIDLPEWRSVPVTITAPFLAAGLFHGETSPSSQFDVAIRGGGTITVNLSPGPLGRWAPDTFRYDFVVTPTPEPATLTMVGGALVGAAGRLRRRRDHRTAIQLSTSTPTM